MLDGRNGCTVVTKFKNFELPGCARGRWFTLQTQREGDLSHILHNYITTART